MSGRFRYSDLKEAAVSGAGADLWALNGVELLLVGWVVWVGMWSERLNREFVEADGLWHVAWVCRQEKPEAVKAAQSVDRVCMRKHGVGSRLKVMVHAARLSA